MGRRIYVANFNAVSVGTAVQDMWSLFGSASNGVQLHRLDAGASGITTATQINVRLKMLPATVTIGSGGSTPTKNPVDQGDSKAAQSTLHANDTSQATTSGTAQNLEVWQWNLLLPFDHMGGPEDEDREGTLVSQALVFDLPGTIAGAVTLSSNIRWREYP